MVTDWLLTVSLFFHLVATVAWLGGLTLLSLIIMPNARALLARREGTSALLSLLDKLRKRFQVVANVSLLVLLVTGLYQMSASPFYTGFLQFDNDWSRAMLVKHIAVIGMIGVGAVMQFGVLPALERASLLAARGKESGEVERLRLREQRLTTINLILGAITLACTAIATAIR
ncbi:MAG: CopD family protein [Anaerolineae bacterium]|nr:CopD family protein [Anaerolineae bacterium]MDW8299238.1 CopD family protein [Anaerolineae bacterium]